MRDAYTIAGLTAAVLAIFAAVAGFVRWLVRVVDEWRGVQLAVERASQATAECSAQTARLAAAMHHQVNVLLIREAEDRRQIVALTAWQTGHERRHHERGI